MASKREASATPAWAGIGRHATSAHRAAPPASTAQIARRAGACLACSAIPRGRDTGSRTSPVCPSAAAGRHGQGSVRGRAGAPGVGGDPRPPSHPPRTASPPPSVRPCAPCVCRTRCLTCRPSLRNARRAMCTALRRCASGRARTSRTPRPRHRRRRRPGTGRATCAHTFLASSRLNISHSTLSTCVRRAPERTHRRTRAHTRMHAHTCAHANTQTRTHAHTHTRTHAHTHAQVVDKILQDKGEGDESVGGTLCCDERKGKTGPYICIVCVCVCVCMCVCMCACVERER